VSRAQLGTEATDHAAGAVVEANVRWPRPSIKHALLEEILSWPDDLYEVKDKTIQLTAHQATFDIGVRNAVVVINVLREPKRIFAGSDRWTNIPFAVNRGMPRTDYASGMAIQLQDRAKDALRVRVIYGKRFEVDDVEDTTDVVDDWGLEPTMIDIPPLGAAMTLTMASEIQRTDSDPMGESRIAAEVPATFRTQTAQALKKLRDKRINEEQVRLRQRYRRPS